MKRHFRGNRRNERKRNSERQNFSNDVLVNLPRIASELAYIENKSVERVVSMNPKSERGDEGEDCKVENERNNAEEKSNAEKRPRNFKIEIFESVVKKETRRDKACRMVKSNFPKEG